MFQNPLADMSMAFNRHWKCIVWRRPPLSLSKGLVCLASRTCADGVRYTLLHHYHCWTHKATVAILGLLQKYTEWLSIKS